MRRIVQASCLLLFLSLTFLQAQTSVTLNIDHLLNDEDYARGLLTTNNLDNEFQFDRLEYYIAEISLIHDGGQETPVSDLYLLIDAAEETSVELGEFAVTDLEAIRFHVGVDEAKNHLDPATYPNTHPLAPKFPSMHWGWTSGYRFLAIEGKSGANLSENWEIHALEDENYFQTEVAISLSAVDGAISINLDANYSKALEDIDLSSGPIVHGGYGEAKKSLQNFRDYVYTPSEVVSSTIDFSEVQNFQVYPNPVIAPASAQFRLATTTATGEYAVRVTNVNGQVVQHFKQVSSNVTQPLHDLSPGVYFVNLYKEGVAVMHQKLVVQ